MSRVVVFFLMVVAPGLSLCLALLGLDTLGENFLGWFLFLLGVAYPAGGVIYFFIRRQPFWRSIGNRPPAKEEKGDRSFWLILPGFLVAFFAPPLEWMYLPDLLPRGTWMEIAGLALILLGIAFRLWSRSHIRGLYSGHVEVQEDHRLVQSGPYRFVRHPGYTGFLLITLGVVLGYSSAIGLGGMVLFLLPGLAYRIQVEERLLAEQFGEEYRDYVRRSKRLIPGIW
jgi:protein-S-isoprenylcysteine O-methyltransferase Ste14